MGKQGVSILISGGNTWMWIISIIYTYIIICKKALQLKRSTDNSNIFMSEYFINVRDYINMLDHQCQATLGLVSTWMCNRFFIWVWECPTCSISRVIWSGANLRLIWEVRSQSQVNLGLWNRNKPVQSILLYVYVCSCMLLMVNVISLHIYCYMLPFYGYTWPSWLLTMTDPCNRLSTQVKKC